MFCIINFVLLHRRNFESDMQHTRSWSDVSCVKFTRDLSGRCLRHSFGKSSKSHAFTNFKHCTINSLEPLQNNNVRRVPSSTVASRAFFSRHLLSVKVKVPLRLTVSQSVCLDVEPLLVLMTRCMLLFDGYCHVFVGRPLWRVCRVWSQSQKLYSVSYFSKQSVTLFICWCSSRGITCSIVAALSDARRTAWQRRLSPLSYRCVKSPQCLPSRSLATAVTLSSLFRLSDVMSHYCPSILLFAL
jgi:hypothetical protein